MNATCERAHISLTTHPMGDLFAEGANCQWQTRIVTNSREGEEVLFDEDEGLEVGSEINHFLECVSEGKIPETDGRTARKIVELAFNAYKDADLRGGNVRI